MSAPATVPVATGSLFASFADDVSPGVRELLRAAEVAGLRGDPDLGLTSLAEASGSGDLGEDDLVAIAEMTGMLRVWGGSADLSVEIFEACASRTQQPRARGAVLLSRARSLAADFADFSTQALAEFSAAGDLRGQAVSLARLALGSVNTPAAHRFRLGREAVELAEQLGDPWTLAFCQGHLASLETYLGAPGVIEHWHQAVAVETGRADSLAAQMITMNYSNLVFTSIGHGDYTGAASAIAQGRATAHGTTWVSRFATLQAWLNVRTGRLRDAADTAAREAAGPRPYGSFASAVAAAVDYERERHLESATLADQLDSLIGFSEQVACSAAGVLAMTRHARNEPNPGREARAALQRVRKLGYRFGWEDAMLALALVSPGEAAEELALMAPLWPDNARGQAIRPFVEGLLSDDGFDLLVDAAARLRDLREPVTAGWALHAAARVAPGVEAGNQLRRQAMELFEQSGAERSLAAVVRDRKLPRGQAHVPVPGSQARATTAGLTAKEREVAVLAARGLTAAEIAAELGISLGTVRNHLMRVREKFGGIPKRQLAQALGIRADHE